MVRRQGLTVFVVSWVNPDAKLAEKSFEDYMREGIIAALDAVDGSDRRKTGAHDRLLRRRHAARDHARLSGGQGRRPHRAPPPCSPRRSISPMPATSRCSSTRSASRNSKKHMSEHGYLEGSRMATAFNMLRSNDLIWPYVDQQLSCAARSRSPSTSCTGIPTRRACRRRTIRSICATAISRTSSRKGQMTIGGVTLDLGKVTMPIYNLATREDHIAPAKSVLLGSKFFGGPVKFVLAGSGHIAGVVNPPGTSRSTSTGPAKRRAARPRQLARRRPRASRLVVAGLARVDQGARRARRCRRASSAAASSSRSRTRRAPT